MLRNDLLDMNNPWNCMWTRTRSQDVNISKVFIVCVNISGPPMENIREVARALRVIGDELDQDSRLQRYVMYRGISIFLGICAILYLKKYVVFLKSACPFGQV